MNKDGVESVLEFLAERYLEEHPISSKKIEEIQKQMNPYFEQIELDASNKMFQLVYDLCSSYEAAAFRTGLQLGLRFQDEITLTQT